MQQSMVAQGAVTPQQVMQQGGVASATAAMPQQVPLLARITGKFVLEVLPAALASVIGGFLFTQYQFGRPAVPPPAAEQAEPATSEMMKFVRDEHGMILDFLKAEEAAEKTRLAANDKEASAAVDAKGTVPSARRIAAAKPRSKPAVTVAAAAPVTPPRTQVLVARAEQVDSPPPAAAAAAAPAPSEHKSLADKTLAIRDHVLSATWHAVSTIGSIPSWIGHRLDGDSAARTSSASS